MPLFLYGAVALYRQCNSEAIMISAHLAFRLTWRNSLVDGNQIDRLSQIQTAWSVLFQAHAGSGDAVWQAQAAILERYQTAVKRYLLGAVRDVDLAEELFQEFALRFVKGQFGKADPERGRFRDYVRTSLSNLIKNHRNKSRNRPSSSLSSDVAVEASVNDTELDRDFIASWRTALLDRAWEGLAALQKPGGPAYYSALRLRTERHELNYEQLASMLTQQLHPPEPFNDSGVRKVIQRARDLLTDLLLDEVARSLQTSCLERLEQEVIDLGFQAYCKRALERRKGRP